ncbi:Uncharacterized protein PECH_005919 [Penicillium ucsense]|uniref:F-box domain-containing protein n=1 Tax=Penicillium ucsense TaxID=2839758 RepID=A0A8J8W7J4_9EURO|nr:Uncharacterized protein PECM_002121 [Penicillium ucsense]KAF7735996.1 Uncharacterized protein PECH_005919 [Penicillium ucsense]
MATTSTIYLPAEVRLMVVGHLLADDAYDANDQGMHERQRDLWNLCLVSFGWYEAAIKALYVAPQLWRGNKFTLFTKTVCPSRAIQNQQRREHIRTPDFGSWVEDLNMSRLVHQSSNSQTARLLGNVKKSLTSFTAPQMGIAVNCLGLIAKCQRLKHLDMSLVPGSVFGFPRLKQLVHKLPELQILHLPRSMALTRTTQEDGRWPSKLSTMSLGGSMDAELMLDFDWPPSLSRLVLRHCISFDTPVMEDLLSHDHLCTHLQALTIGRSNLEMFEDGMGSEILYELQQLTYLKLPWDLLPYLFLVPPNVPGVADEEGEVPILPLRVLEITKDYFSDHDAELDFSFSLSRALDENLRNLLALGIERSCRSLLESRFQELDAKIWDHVSSIPDSELMDSGIDDLGIYFIEEDPE